MERKNVVRTFNAYGKCMSEQFFDTKEKAYEEYVAIIENANHLPKGYEMTVARYSANHIMGSTTVVGTQI